MNILIGVPHVFRPQDGSVLSSQTEAKRALKAAALQQVTRGTWTCYGAGRCSTATTNGAGWLSTRLNDPQNRTRPQQPANPTSLATGLLFQDRSNRGRPPDPSGRHTTSGACNPQFRPLP
jgi:hypothetical protein